MTDLEAALKAVEGKIADAYWRFGHSPSPRVGPPSADLYRQRTELKAEIRAQKPFAGDVDSR